MNKFKIEDKSSRFAVGDVVTLKQDAYVMYMRSGNPLTVSTIIQNDGKWWLMFAEENSSSVFLSDAFELLSEWEKHQVKVVRTPKAWYVKATGAFYLSKESVPATFPATELYE